MEPWTSVLFVRVLARTVFVDVVVFSAGKWNPMAKEEIALINKQIAQL